MLLCMDSIATPHSPSPTWSSRLPGWALSRGRDIAEPDAAYASGIALKSLDDLIRAEPPWLGCWHDRLALKSAGVAVRMLGRSEEETGIRDAALLTATGDSPSVLARRSALSAVAAASGPPCLGRGKGWFGPYEDPSADFAGGRKLRLPPSDPSRAF
ncbi:MAG: DUF1403 family protein [Rhizobium pusense]|nr:DUF1403 family protein [Agrobacterium pusense]